MKNRDGTEITPWHCFAAFLGPLESLVCGNTPRQIVIQLDGRERLLFDVDRTIRTFTPTIRSFNNRERGLAPWNITCEDDARDLLYVMLRPLLFDLVKEEPVPSLAGTYKFVDLCSKATELFVELKHIKRSGQWKKIVDEIRVDIQTYITHPQCRDLVFVILDSSRDIRDPRLIENDLAGEQKVGTSNVQIRTIVCEP